MSGIGLPDWYNIKKAGAVSALGDLGELAARLGSIHYFDRRGDVVFLDSFDEGLLKWSSTTVGTGAAVALSNAKVRSGGWSVLLTAGSDGSRYATISHPVPFPVLSQFGLECSFLLDWNLDTLIMAFSLYSGTTLRTAALRYDYPGQLLQYQDDAGNYQDLATGVDLYYAGAPFWTWKIVADFTAGEYVRAILNETEYDLSGVALRSVVSAVIPLLEVWIQNKGVAATNAQVYLDDVIITQNEP